jgi:hypothetical protein
MGDVLGPPRPATPLPPPPSSPLAAPPIAAGDPFARVDLPSGLYTAEFRDRIAEAEGNRRGYAELNPRKAWGRYQLTELGLMDAGMMDRHTKQWTGSLAKAYGIRNEGDFLANKEAQEDAFNGYMVETEKQLRRLGATGFVGKEIMGKVARFTVSESGLAAAAHRQGAPTVKAYLDHVAMHGGRMNPDALDKRLIDPFLRIETRLRTFAGMRHRTR